MTSGAWVIHAPGPNHSDADRSLCVWLDDDDPEGFRVASLATRDADDWKALREHVRRAVGLEPWRPNGKGNGHAKPNGHAKTKGQLVGHYVYETVMGEPVLRVSRFANPKSFSQSRPDGAGGWTPGGAPPDKLVLFRLPEITEAIALDKPIFVNEGEKGALAMWKHGLAATCSPMGAGKWREQYAASLKDANVIIIADNDEPGRKHAEDVAASLEGVAASARIVNLPGLPVGGDVVNYIEAGGDPYAIINLKPGPPKRGFTAAELWDMEFEPIKYAVPRYLPEGLTLLAGAPKRGKSWLALDLCVAVGFGGYALDDQKCQQGDALYCALEDSPRRIKERLHRICQLGGAAPDRLTVWFGSDLMRIGSGCEEALRGWIESAEAPRLIIIDTLNYVRPERTRDEDPYAYDYRTAVAIQRLAHEFGLAIVMVHHTRKTVSEDYLEAISGTNGLTGGSDAVMVLERGQEGTYSLKGRGRDIEEFDIAMRFDRESCRWSVLGDAQEARQSETRTKILRLLEEATWPLTAPEIAQQLGQATNAVAQRLFHLVKAGEVDRVGRGKYRLPSKTFVIDGGLKDGPETDDDDDDDRPRR